MKRRDLIRKLKKNGWWKLREGSNHDIYTNGVNSEPIPRHNEINESLARSSSSGRVLNKVPSFR